MVSIREDGKVEFKFYRPDALDVRIAGDFDKWNGDIQMRTVGKGWWFFDADLPAGEYRFRYRADGKWFTDYAAYGVEFSQKQQGWNSVLIVPELPAAMASVEEESEQNNDAVRIAA